MAKLALHQMTADQLARFVSQPSHAVLLTGAKGIGKQALARQLAADLLHVEVAKLADYAYVRQIAAVDGKAIGIEPIRELEHFLSLKVPGTAELKRMILIEDSHLLGLEAQNALLKTLEEPPADTVIILTAVSDQSLLPTIRSRVQSITVVKPSKAALQTVLDGGANFDSVYTISGGLPGLTQAMLSDDQTHPLRAAVSLARELLGQTSYERLLHVDTLAKNKPLAQDTCAILQHMAHISLQTATGPASKRWQHILTSSYEAAEALDASGNAKLVLTDLFINL